MTLWWLSFINPDLPRGARNLGVAIVPATDISTAADKAWELGCNPGGEVAGWPLPPQPVVPDEYIGKLLTLDEADKLRSAMLRRMDPSP